MLAQEREAFGKAGEHAQRQHIHLEHAERFDIVLVPGDDGAVLHRGVFDGHELVEAAARDEKAARMLRKVAREAGQRAGQLDAERQPPVPRVEAKLPQLFGADDILAPA